MLALAFTADNASIPRNVPTIDRLEAYLKEALAATAPGSIERQRVEFFAAPWQKDFTAAT